MSDGLFSWGTSLTEARWRELGASVNASELQIKFACAKFHGATNSGAAKLAGYAGNDSAIRTAGYSAYRTTAVQNLLELAAIHSPEDAGITPKELDARIAKLCRSPDPQVSLKAIEAHQKRETIKAATAQENAQPDAIANLKELAASNLIVAFLVAHKNGVAEIEGLDRGKAIEELHALSAKFREQQHVPG